MKLFKSSNKLLLILAAIMLLIATAMATVFVSSAEAASSRISNDTASIEYVKQSRAVTRPTPVGDPLTDFTDQNFINAILSYAFDGTFTGVNSIYQSDVDEINKPANNLVSFSFTSKLVCVEISDCF